MAPAEAELAMQVYEKVGKLIDKENILLLFTRGSLYKLYLKNLLILVKNQNKKVRVLEDEHCRRVCGTYYVN